jgi:anthranilate synthase component I
MKLRIEVTQIDATTVDLARCYEMTARAMGEDNVFLLESMAGPATDCRESILGLNRLVEIRFREQIIEVRGIESISSFILTKMRQVLRQDDRKDGSIPIKSRHEFWQALRALLFAFDEDKSGSGSGFLACISYEAGQMVESVPPKSASHRNRPLITLALFQAHVTVSVAGAAAIAIKRGPGFPAMSVDSVQELVNATVGMESPAASSRPPASARFSMSEVEFLKAASRALEYIRAGDIYQVQLGHEIQVSTALSPIALYRNLQRGNPSPYMFICRLAGVDLVGASPESYIRLEQGLISMRPIAGTIAKTAGQTHERLIAKLTDSAKENAEHVMLVDLCRNDIGRACSDLTLDVPDLLTVGEFSNLFHIISTVTGQLSPECDVVDLIQATFPAGTMVGAPKIRAMEIIEELEQSERRFYAGAVGLIGFGNHANLALCIRMVTREDSVYRLRASAGIVVDSDPRAEWKETLTKMSRMYQALTGEELPA